jgi:L-fuculokinase
VNDDVTLVIDIGKSHAKLLMLSPDGEVVERHGRDNGSVTSALGYPALDVHGLEQWMTQTLRASPNARRCSRVIASTHGAALVALGDEGLAWEPVDYEFDGLAGHPELARSFSEALDPFAQTLSPDLPAGLNAARQLFYMEQVHPAAWARTRCLLPYPQYWAWRLSGVHSSEVSSLGCHTHLWQPRSATFSALALDRGWAPLFAPLRPAWESLATITPEAAQAWGLPAHCQVHAGVHDSNACLARYLGALPDMAQAGKALTVVSSGTWTVLMAPGAASDGLTAERDMLANVDVLGRATPTARFMGGREFEFLLAGAGPDAGDAADVQWLLQQGVMAMPSFAANGGPFRGRAGGILQGDTLFPDTVSAGLTPGQRAALAALYCAQITTFLVDCLWQDSPRGRTVVLEGPLARNSLYLGLLTALMPGTGCWVSEDPVEGTARGAWMLSCWGRQLPPELAAVGPMEVPGLSTYQARWLSALDR